MVDEQGLWRAVHAVGAAQGLDGAEIRRLRAWAAEEANQRPFRVFDAKKGGDLRSSFGRSAEIEAQRLIDARKQGAG